MQKITDKQFILSVFIRTIFKIDIYRTKIERKFRENGRNFRKNEIENFNENTSKFAKVWNENVRKFRWKPLFNTYPSMLIL